MLIDRTQRSTNKLVGRKGQLPERFVPQKLVATHLHKGLDLHPGGPTESAGFPVGDLDEIGQSVVCRRRYLRGNDARLSRSVQDDNGSHLAHAFVVGELVVGEPDVARRGITRGHRRAPRPLGRPSRPEGR